MFCISCCFSGTEEHKEISSSYSRCCHFEVTLHISPQPGTPGSLVAARSGQARVTHKAIKRLLEAYAQPPPLSTHTHVSASLGQHLTKSQMNSARGAARGWWWVVAGCAEAPFRQVLPEGGGGGAGTTGGGGVAGCGRAGGGLRWASRLVYTSQYQS